MSKNHWLKAACTAMAGVLMIGAASGCTGGGCVGRIVRF